MKLTTLYAVIYKGGRRRYCRSLSAAVREARHATHIEGSAMIVLNRLPLSTARELQEGPECVTTPNETC